MDMPGMTMDEKGAVMNENKDELPKDCPKVSEDIRIEVHAGRKYANKFNGLMFSFDQNEWRATPCSRVTVHFVNDDKVRHQWMIHGLPKYIYPAGLFHLEVTGPGEKTGTFILPNLERTYFVHCDIAQHMEKGMKAQVKVGKGSGDLPSIPGISGQIYPDTYDTIWTTNGIAAVSGGGALGLLAALVLRRRMKAKNGKESGAAA
jgi:plastocyanin